MRRLVLLLALLAVAGCGGGDKGLSKADFIAKWDDVCGNVNAQTDDLDKQIEAINSGTTGAKTPEEALHQAAPLFDKATTIYSDALKDLKAADPPEADKQLIDGLLSKFDGQVVLLQKAADAARAGDVDALQSTSAQITKTAEETRATEKTYGFKVCSVDSST